MSQFYILSATNPELAIQASPDSGGIVTLQTLDTSNPLQIWEAQLQIGGGWLGIAFVNPQTNMSVTYNGEKQPLVMQDFSLNSGDRDSWYFTQGQQGGNVFRIALPEKNSWTWNDEGAKLQPGDTIQLYNSTKDNSLWTIQFV